MRKIILITIACFFSNLLHAQTIEGTVYDAKNGETIPGVVIYFDGTTILTTSDRDGNFKLVSEKNLNANLVFSHMSYESLIIKPPFVRTQKKFLLIEKQNQLTAAVVTSDRHSRADKMRVFKEQFLGEGQAGKACVIVNEEDIVLNYDSNSNMLTGYSIQPIVVENKYLAYTVTFDLHYFSIRYANNTLNMNKAIKVSFKGTSSFVDKSPYNIIFLKRRDELFLISKQNFFKNLVANTLDENNYRIYNRLVRIQPEQYFLTIDNASQKTVLVLPETNLRRSHERVIDGPIYGVIGIVDGKTNNSELVFLTNRFSVDNYGNPDNIDDLIFFGEMGKHRLGEMLPQNYEYVSK